MEDLNPFVQTSEQPGAGPGAEAMPTDPVPESSGARRPVEESTAPAGGLGGGERLGPTADGSVAMPGATAETAGSSAANAGDAGATPESAAAKPVAPEEQPAPPEASQGVVGLAVRPRSPPVVPLAAAEEDEVEEIILIEN